MNAGVGGFRSLDLSGRYRTAWDRPAERFYVPVLSRAVRYDRLVGYWRSSTLVVAATALSYFAARRGKMRVIAGAELTPSDIAAIRSGTPLEDAVARRLVEAPEEAGDIVAEHRWEVLAWMLREELLEIRIGVPADDDGEPLPASQASRYFHSKFGVFEDGYGDLIAFSGSDNESATAWRGNHETFHVYRSWGPTETWLEHGYPTVADFETHWNATVPGWKVIDFPDEAHDHLLQRAPVSADWVPPPDPAAPPEPPVTDARTEIEELRDAPSKDGGTGVGLATAPIPAWPHQERIAARILDTWPRSYVLADEVGLGKTIEAGLVVRELTLSGRAERILLLVPASVQRQWQEELWEKFCLDVPSYTGREFVNVDGDRIDSQAALNPWSAFPVVLASSHLARMRKRRREILSSGRWDLVIVDEAHHARRRGTGAESANQLLQLLREMRDGDQWDALILASATPMQMHTHEIFDLLDLVGLPGRWGDSPERFEDYFRQLAEPDPKARSWSTLRTMVGDYLSAEDTHPNPIIQDQVRRLSGPSRLNIERFHVRNTPGSHIATRPAEERSMLDRWLRANTPLRDRVFRTTREALREYKRQGILPGDAVIPNRHIDDRMIRFSNDAESQLYERIEDYITRYYESYSADKATKPLGFIMTVYRRRLTSSLYAVQQSLKRRLEGLQQQAAAEELLDDDDRYALENSLRYDPDQLSDQPALHTEIDELESFVSDLESAIPHDTKVQTLSKDIDAAFRAGHRTVVVFTQYTDTLHWLRDHLKGTYGNKIACYTGGAHGGSRYDPTTDTWTPLPKGVVKELFRQGDEVRILLGTDAMSEGLNLQTCDRLFNYDMPWNFMRVEQRIGRIDRIGGQPNITVTNYFYQDTVEEQVYTGLREDADWFQQVVGPAQPILSRVESVIEDIAMRSSDTARRQALEEQLTEVRQAITAAQTQPVDIHTLDDDALPQLAYGSMPATTLDDIERILTTNPLTREHMHTHPDFDRTYYVETHGDKIPMTFDWNTYDHNPEIGFMTYGHPVLTQVISESI